MIHCRRTDAENPDFIRLIEKLDAELAVRDGDDHPFYARFNRIQNIKHVIVLYENDVAVGCGAIKFFEPGTAEVKRMFTLPEKRRQGYAVRVLSELERWAAELTFHCLVLETGQKQPEAIALYGKLGYTRIPNYGQYSGVKNSVCFEKKLNEAD
jgi:GNAT superfamily N-acetyltransferase